MAQSRGRVDNPYPREYAAPEPDLALKQQWTELRGLIALQAAIARLPAGIRLLKELEHLELNGCQLETLPPEIAELPLLKVIRLEQNPLKSPPVEIAARA